MADAKADLSWRQTAEVLAAVWNANQARWRRQLWRAEDFYRPSGTPRPREGMAIRSKADFTFFRASMVGPKKKRT